MTRPIKFWSIFIKHMIVFPRWNSQEQYDPSKPIEELLDHIENANDSSQVNPAPYSPEQIVITVFNFIFHTQHRSLYQSILRKPTKTYTSLKQH